MFMKLNIIIYYTRWTSVSGASDVSSVYVRSVWKGGSGRIFGRVVRVERVRGESGGNER